MPISRKKSCLHCRRAKARCNLARTCSHCSDRGLQCSYAPFSDATVPVTRLNEPALLEEISEPGPENRNPARGVNGEMCAFDFSEPDPVGFIIEDLEWPSLSWSSGIPPCLESDGITPGAFGEMLGLPGRPPSGSLFSNDGHLSPSQEFVHENNDGAVLIRGHLYRDLNSPHNSIKSHSLLTTRFIRGQIKGYPTLLLHGQLPPFIYPVCVLSGQLPQNCVLNGVHQCLSPPLAVCASLVRIWEARTPATVGFLWGSIYAEVKRLSDECHEYSDDELLGAFQALSIYLLLQAQDLKCNQQNDVVAMDMPLMEIGRNLSRTKSASHLRNLFTLSNLSQRIWAFNESIRRTMAFLFILDSLLREGIRDHRDPMRCGGTETMPLPGPRSLWDHNIPESWAFRLERLRSSNADSGLDQHLTLGDLRKAGEGGKEAIVDRLARWCESADEFGGLLRLSALLI